MNSSDPRFDLSHAAGDFPGDPVQGLDFPYQEVAAHLDVPGSVGDIKGDLVHGGKGFQDLAAAGPLLHQGLFDLGLQGADELHVADDFFEGFFRFRCGVHHGVNRSEDLFQGDTDGLGLDGALFRQFPDFVGHHRKAPAAVSGVGRLDGGVHGQQVGLGGDAGDDGVGLLQGFGFLRYVFHLVHHVGNFYLTLIGKALEFPEKTA